MTGDDKLWISVGGALWFVVFWLYLRDINNTLAKILRALSTPDQTGERKEKG